MGLLVNTFTEILVTSSAPPATVPPQLLDAPPVVEKLASERLATLFEIRLSAPSNDALQRIVDSLVGLEDGWFGSGSVAPSGAVVDDLETALSGALLSEDPTVEVDTDGSVALIWELPAGASLTLTFVGNGQVVGSVFPQSASNLPWAFPARARDQIASRLVERGVASRPS